MPETHDPVITISLLDPVAGYAVQSWEFDGVSLIRIGRADTNDVVLSDTTVSRMHGELTHDPIIPKTGKGSSGILLHYRKLIILLDRVGREGYNRCGSLKS